MSAVLDTAFLFLCISLGLGTGNYLRSFLFFLFIRIVFSNIGRRCLQTLPRDIRGIILLIKIKLSMRKAFRRNEPLHSYFLDWVQTHPNKECIVEVESGRSFSFAQINELANRYANAFNKEGFKSEAVVGLFLENSADFFALWLGLSKLNIVTAWINSNLKLGPLAHSILTAKCECVITSKELYSGVKAAINEGLLPKSTKVYTVDGAPDTTDLRSLLKDSAEPKYPKELSFKSVLCYVYTSGTTGNPKPAVIKHYRYYFVTLAAGFAFGLHPNDRFYVTMPMYHSAAGIIGVGQIPLRGVTIAVRRKFSASNFWTDAQKHNCTASQYIGEICRYLLAQKPSDADRSHSIRVMYGNGLRPEIWAQFVERFGIRRIGELYGSTEGNSNIVNIDNHVGSCGFFPIYPGLTAFYPVQLVKVDLESGELIRNSKGLCVSCQPGDVGEMVGLINNNDPLLSFEGYVNKEDTQKKILRDVFRKGDMVFSTGDVLFWDKMGYLYFRDRRGDTYRWRGENVSTTEVEGILQPILEIEDATVFGVEVKGREGRAGMIGATLRPEVDLQDFIPKLSKRVSEHLPSYGIPVFVRLCSNVDRTGTFKLKKSALSEDGFDPKKCRGEPLFFWDSQKKLYLPLTSQIYSDILSGVYTKI